MRSTTLAQSFFSEVVKVLFLILGISVSNIWSLATMIKEKSVAVATLKVIKIMNLIIVRQKAKGESRF